MQPQGNSIAPRLPPPIYGPVAVPLDPATTELGTYKGLGDDLRRAGTDFRKAVPLPDVPFIGPADDTVLEPMPQAQTGLDRTADISRKISIGLGPTVNAMDVARGLKKFPEAFRAKHFDKTLGFMGRLDGAIAQTAIMAPNATLIDPTAPAKPTVESKGRSFTAFDKRAMQFTSLVSSFGAGVQVASAVPNLVKAVGEDGVWYRNLAEQKEGRYGVLQAAGGTLGLSMLGIGIKQGLERRRAEDAKVSLVHPERAASAAAPATRTARVKAATTAKLAAPANRIATAMPEPVRQASRVIGKGAQLLIDAGKAPIMAKPSVKYISLAAGVIVGVNELGFLDAMNKGDDRAVATTLKDAAHRTPIVNDADLRSYVIGAAGGIVGWKVTQKLVKNGQVRIAAEKAAKPPVLTKTPKPELAKGILGKFQGAGIAVRELGHAARMGITPGSLGSIARGGTGIAAAVVGGLGIAQATGALDVLDRD